MTEEEWLASVEPEGMLNYLSDKASDRKLRLFACECVRQVYRHLADEEILPLPEALLLAERFCDGSASAAQVRAALSRLGDTGGYSAARAANEVLRGVLRYTDIIAAHRAAICVASHAVFTAAENEGLSNEEVRAVKPVANKRSADALHDIFGPIPFRPVALNTAWLSSTVNSLARSIYTERTFDLMPVLADALEEAGCDQPDILSHCRGGGVHVRGCWVVDLCLGKE